MMVVRAGIAIAAVMLAGTGSTSAARSDSSRILWRGPVLAGDGVLWTEEAGATGSLHLWNARDGDRSIYRSDALAVTRPVAGSRMLVAFERSFPSCPPAPGGACPQAADIMVGPLTGPFRRLTGPQTCFLPRLERAVALDGAAAAYVTLDCTRERLSVVARNVVRDEPPRVLRTASFSADCCNDVALAGRYVAWAAGRDVVVFDRVSRRIAYRVRIGPAGIDVNFGFDVQRDGTVAVAYRPVEFARAGRTTIAWASPSEPRLHMLPTHGADTRVAIAGGHVAFERFTSSTAGALVVADLRGHERTLARFSSPTRMRGDLAFDGRHIAWAADRVTSTRTDCPPPGQERPCVQRETGVTTVWVQDLSSGERQRVARLAYSDALAHPQPAR